VAEPERVIGTAEQLVEHVRALLDRRELAVDADPPAADLDARARNADDALQQDLVLLGRVEHHHVADRRAAEARDVRAGERDAQAVGGLVDQDVVVDLDGRLHRPAGDGVVVGQRGPRREQDQHERGERRELARDPARPRARWWLRHDCSTAAAPGGIPGYLRRTL
jgi:hypothetical protein